MCQLPKESKFALVFCYPVLLKWEILRVDVQHQHFDVWHWLIATFILWAVFMGSVLFNSHNKADMIVSYKTVILCSTRKSYSSRWNVSISSWTGGKIHYLPCVSVLFLHLGQTAVIFFFLLLNIAWSERGWRIVKASETTETGGHTSNPLKPVQPWRLSLLLNEL